MTKADRIRQLAQEHPDWKTGQIGKACDCRPEYVRVVLRQRVEGGKSEIDRRYEASSLGRIMIKKRQPKRVAYQLARYRTGDKITARSAGRKAYREAKANGETGYEAARKYFRAYSKAMVRTGDKAEGRAAYRSCPAEASP
jgi:hypothetical protein